MFDIGFPELVVVSIIALLVLGPDRLPEALRTMGLWFGRLQRNFSAVKSELEKEIGMDDIRRQLHNEAVMQEMERIEAEVKDSMALDEAQEDEAQELDETFNFAHDSSDTANNSDVQAGGQESGPNVEHSIAPPTSPPTNSPDHNLSNRSDRVDNA